MKEQSVNYEFINNSEAGNDFIVSVGFLGGMTTKIFLINEEKAFQSNLAFGEFVVEYLKILLPEYDFDVNVMQNYSALCYKVPKIDLIDSMLRIQEALIQTEWEEKAFRFIKSELLKKFREDCKIPTYVAYERAVEFANSNKSYTLEKREADLTKITYEELLECRNQLLVARNFYFCCCGNTEHLDKSKLSTFSFDDRDWSVTLPMMDVDPYLKQDMMHQEPDMGEFCINIITFDFIDVRVAPLLKYWFLALYQQFAEVPIFVISVDEADTSLICMEDDFVLYKESFRNPLKEEVFYRIRDELFARYLQELRNHPEIYTVEFVGLMANGVNVTEFLSWCCQASYETYLAFFRDFDSKVTEAVVVENKEMMTGGK